MKYGEALKVAREMYGDNAFIETFSRDGGVTWGARVLYGSEEMILGPTRSYEVPSHRKAEEVSDLGSEAAAYDTLRSKLRATKMAFERVSRGESDG